MNDVRLKGGTMGLYKICTHKGVRTIGASTRGGAASAASE